MLVCTHFQIPFYQCKTAVLDTLNQDHAQNINWQLNERKNMKQKAETNTQQSVFKAELQQQGLRKEGSSRQQ